MNNNNIEDEIYTINNNIFSEVNDESIGKFLTIEKNNDYYLKRKLFNTYKIIHDMYYRNCTDITKNYNKIQIDNIYLYEKKFMYYLFFSPLIKVIFIMYFLFNKINIINSLLLLSLYLYDMSSSYNKLNIIFKLKIPDDTPDNINNFTNIAHLKLMIYYYNYVNTMIFFKINKLIIDLILTMYLYLLYNDNLYFTIIIFTDLILYSIYIFFMIFSIIGRI